MSDPVQAHFVAALTRRLQTAPEAVQRVLRERLQQTWPDHATEAPPSRPARTRAPSPLAQLNRDIAANAPPARELRSAQRFRETWERLGAEAAVVKATHRAPENAGPLNSHMLVLRTLGLMRELSPHYLRRFLSHTESLLWLEQAQGQLKAPAGKGKAVKAARQKK